MPKIKFVSELTLKKHNGCRIRLRRLSDREEVAGWILDVSRDGFTVGLTVDGNATTGDQYLARIQDDIGDMAFTVQLGDLVDLRETLERGFCADHHGIKRVYTAWIHTYLGRVPSDGEPRRLLPAFDVALTHPKGILTGSTLDCSKSGLAIFCCDPLEKDIQVEAEIKCPSGDLRLEGVVRSCVQLKSDGLPFRIGLHISAKDRITLARVRQLANEDLRFNALLQTSKMVGGWRFVS